MMTSWLTGAVLAICVAAPVAAQGTLDIGIFGTVESVEPLVVAGQRIVVPAGVPVLSALGPGRQILIGDTLAITANFDGAGLLARRMLEIFAIAGPVQNVEGERATILGSEVYLPQGSAVASGDWIVVSGFWSGAPVIARRLRKVEGTGLAQLTGVVEPAGARVRIGGSVVQNAPTPVDAFGGGVWILNGDASADGLRMRLMTKGVFAGQMDVELWQGHASAPVASQTYMIHGTAIHGAFAREADMPAPGAFVSVCAVDGRVRRTAPRGADPAIDRAMTLLGCAG
ncbi:hypothetical protein [uncultured Sulfitobacter sp.]|uniref:hypothetical protein n=1 Tax=uncultured Sulfitobacter sp. TaxID=191468 RepID=UPI0026122E1B|nr:hypothetical protein [uncultured Sulfitobacter sp.]